MQDAKQNLEFDRTRYITLNEGFDRVGRFKFPNEWTGTEAFAWHKADSDRYADDIQELNEYVEITQNALEIFLQNLPLNMTIEASRSNRERAEVLRFEAHSARRKSNQFGPRLNQKFVDAKAYYRRHKVEMHLCEALRDKKIKFFYRHGGHHEIGSWFDGTDFRISFAFSVVVENERGIGPRRQNAYFDKLNFDAWAAPQETGPNLYSHETLNEQMANWFLSYRNRRPKTPPFDKKSEVLKEMEKHFGLSDLSRVFNAIWMIYALDSMKAQGAPKKTPRV